MIRVRDKLMLALMIVMLNIINNSSKPSIFETIMIFIVWLVFWAWLDHTFVSRAKLEELIKKVEEKNDN